MASRSEQPPNQQEQRWINLLKIGGLDDETLLAVVRSIHAEGVLDGSRRMYEDMRTDEQGRTML